MLQIHITPQIYENYRYVVLTTTEKYPIQKKSVDDGRCHGRSTGRIGMTPPVAESLNIKEKFRSSEIRKFRISVTYIYK